MQKSMISAGCCRVEEALGVHVRPVKDVDVRPPDEGASRQDVEGSSRDVLADVVQRSGLWSVRMEEYRNGR